MEITLADLLNLEPRLNLGAAGKAELKRTPDLERVVVSWAVTARTTVPHLPFLRGGEVVLLPKRVSATVGDELLALIRESAARDVSAIVYERVNSSIRELYSQVGPDRVALLQWNQDFAPDSEAEINRLLTECRGNLYRIGTELERGMADAAVTQTGLAALLTIAASLSGLSMKVLDVQQRQLAESFANTRVDEVDTTYQFETDEGVGRQTFTSDLARGATLILTANCPRDSVIARFLVDRIATAASSALQRDDAARPRGGLRAEATAALLSESPLSASERRAAALSLGLDPDGIFFVAVSGAVNGADISWALAPLGTFHPAGPSHDGLATLVAATGRIPSASISGRVREVKTRWESRFREDQRFLALSAPANGVASIPRAAREADFVAAMQGTGEFSRRAASFGSVDDVGAMGLLYQLRETTELHGFIDDVLGPLLSRDQRGTLKRTLRAFLESGGSQVNASQRLGIHRNTLSYRLRRIGDLVGRDVADPSSWLTLHLALRASEMLEACTEDH